MPRYQQISFTCNKGKSFIDLVSLPLTHEYLRHFLDLMPYHLFSTAGGLVVRPGAEDMIMHIDQQTIPFQTPIPVGLNIMYALTEFTEEAGATRVVPMGSLA